MVGSRDMKFAPFQEIRSTFRVLLVLAASILISMSVAAESSPSDASVYMVVLRGVQENSPPINNCGNVLESLKTRSNESTNVTNLELEVPLVYEYKKVNIGYIVRMNEFAVEMVSSTILICANICYTYTCVTTILFNQPKAHSWRVTVITDNDSHY